MKWVYATLVASLLLILRSSTAFIAGTSGSFSKVSNLRGSASERPSPEAKALPVGVTSVLLLAGACGAFVASRRSQSATTLFATRTEWYRKVKRASGDRAVFDVTLTKPFGVKLERFPDLKNGGYKGVGISQIVPDGNTDLLNRKVCLEESDPGMWVLEGDKVIGVEGTICEDADLDEIVSLVQAAGEQVTLTLVRDTRKGPIKVILLPGGQTATVRRGSRLSAAAEYAFGKELKYGCIDGWCGTCWHRERTTDGVFKPCCDLLTGDWDNVMPLVLTPKPEKAGDATFLKPRGE
jgi:hypothetical protein